MRNLSRWSYFIVMLSSWIFFTEVRRFLAWRFGTHSELLSLVPILSVVPFLFWTLFTRGLNLDLRLVSCALVWLASFGSALLIGFASGQRQSAIFDFATFCLPVFAGLWVASSDCEPYLAARQLQNALLTFIAITSVYGIVQFVTAPPWDTLWMIQNHTISMGRPAPYKIRVFSTLNASGAFADFVALSWPFVFFRLGGKRAQIYCLPILISIIALGLTLVRIVWVALPIEFLVQLIFIPKRPGRMLGLIFMTCLFGLFVLGSPSSKSLPIISDVINRVSTFRDLETDVSANERKGLITVAFVSAVANPLGSGLGLFGNASRLNSVNANVVDFENGPLERLIEMGFVGAAGYFSVLLGGLAFSFATWKRARAVADDETMSLAAAVMAVQVAVFVIDLGGDAHFNLNGVLFWVSLGLLLNVQVNERLASTAKSTDKSQEMFLRRITQDVVT